ncbi:1-acyl-sn-glycerol-3-phosphate acyltransferase [Erysipelothrix urinaevulpis]|uniref:lysophospholipid acyltransferase family protein n=1 Tax=Erysipelothrix urinaevulpis TaxID=2683717 RepID=UPI001357B88E|nr:lysophospholipid acyltransferase family protein [Erysipelothrix urinaevulpis]
MKKFNMFITFLVLPIYWIRSQVIRRFGSETKKDKELRMYPDHYLGFRRISVKIIGKQPNSQTPCIYIANHQSMNDIFITIAAVNKPFRFIAKKELFTNPISGTFMKMSQSYPLDREDPKQSLMILKQALKDVEKGYSILAFPEGTRSHTKEMLPFKDGMFAVLRKANVPIVPMYIQESFNENQKEFNVHFCQAIEKDTYQTMKTIELSQLVRTLMEEKMKSIYA